MRLQSDDETHQGKLVAQYRSAMKMSQQELAAAMGLSLRTVQRMEKEAVIENPERRKFLVALLGIPAASMALDEKPIKVQLADLLFNDDPMAFLEDMVTTRWKAHLMGGPLGSAQGLERAVKEVEAFAGQVRGKQWHQRAHAQLCILYQLRGSVLGDRMLYQRARGIYHQAFSLASELQDVEMMAAIHVREAIVWMRQEQPLEAITLLSEALKLIRGQGVHQLRGNTLVILSEAYAKAGQAHACWQSIEMAEQALQQKGQTRERSFRTFNPAFVAAHKGVDALIIHDYDRALALIEKSLKIYNPTLTPEHARLLARKAEAYYGKREIIEAASTASEALAMSYAVGASNTISRVRDLHVLMEQSRWRREPAVIHLGMALATPSTSLSKY